jgi:hypothetical protein
LSQPSLSSDVPVLTADVRFLSMYRTWAGREKAGRHEPFVFFSAADRIPITNSTGAIGNVWKLKVAPPIVFVQFHVRRIFEYSAFLGEFF